MKSTFDIQINLDGDVEITQRTVMTTGEFLSYILQVQEFRKGLSRDAVNEVLPPAGGG